jgi:flagellar hook-associated protein 2
MLSPIAASSALTTGTITSQGIGSGLNVASIVSQLMVVQNQPVALLQSQEANNQATVSAFGSLSSALS